MYKCPKCGSLHIMIETIPDEEIKCMDCGHVLSTGTGLPEITMTEVHCDFPTGDKIVVVINGNEPVEDIQEKIEQAIYSKLYRKNPEITNYDLAIQTLREIAQDRNVGAEWRIEACNILKDACEL